MAGGALALACAGPAHADVAKPDPSFGGDGLVRVAFGADASANAAAIAPDGDVVVVGRVQGEDGGDFAIARLNPDGTLDEAFSDDGRLTTNLAAGGASGVAIRPDGDIVVGGTAGDEFAVIELNSDGTLDDSFAGNGVAVFGSGSAADLVLDEGGNVVVAGSGGSERPEGGLDAYVARLTPDGDLDPSFDGNGVVTAGLVDDGSGGPSSDGASGAAIQPDGDIVIAGSTFTIPAGQALFGEIAGDGAVKRLLPIGEGRHYTATDITVLASGESLLTGVYEPHGADYSDALIWLVRADGSITPGGVTPPSDVPQRAKATAVAALPGGRAIGAATSPSSLFLRDPETGFTDYGEIGFVASDVAVGGDGKVVAIGDGQGTNGTEFIAGQFMPPTFDPPQTKITGGPRGRIDRRYVRFKFRSIPSGASFRCRLDHYAWHKCGSPYRLGPLTRIRHRFRVRAVGPTGLRDPTPAVRIFTIS